MSPSDARVVLLRAEVRRDWSAVLDHRARADSVDPGDSEPNAAFVAMALHHAYQAFETLLLRLERSLGLPGRDGERWHERIREGSPRDGDRSDGAAYRGPGGGSERLSRAGW